MQKTLGFTWSTNLKTLSGGFASVSSEYMAAFWLQRRLSPLQVITKKISDPLEVTTDRILKFSLCAEAANGRVTAVSGKYWESETAFQNDLLSTELNLNAGYQDHILYQTPFFLSISDAIHNLSLLIRQNPFNDYHNYTNVHRSKCK